MDKKKTRLLVCPVCYSARIVSYMGGVMGQVYRCLDCGYVGSLVLEMSFDEYVELLKKIKHEKEDNRKIHI